MNRKIKFRAWDEIVNQFRDDNTIHLSSSGMFFILKSDGFGNSAVEFLDNIIIQFFTGLTDKHGKELYEGDIVKTPAKTISVVEFDKGLFGLNHDYGTENKSMLGSWGSECNLRCLYDGYHRDIEIIGNIYENPELING